MSYCYDFIKKFKKEGNFCGLDKSEVSRLEAYIEIMKTLETHDLDEKFIVEMFPLGAARVIIPLKDERRTEGLCYVKEQLLAKKHVTAKALSEKLEISNNKPQSKPKTKKEPQKEEIEKPQSGPVSGLGPVSPDHPNHGVGCAQPGSLPAETDLPPHPPLSEQMKPETPALQMEFPDPSPRPPCLDGKPCPDPNGKDWKKDEPNTRGKVCSLWNFSLADIDGKGCYLEVQRQRRAAAAQAAGGSTFTTAAGNPSPVKVLKELGGVKIVKTPLSDEEKKTLADAFVDRAGRTPKEIRQIDELVEARYERINSRYELIDKAVSWFLTQAEGE